MDGGKVEHGKENSNFGAERGGSGMSGAGKGCKAGPAPEINEGSSAYLNRVERDGMAFVVVHELGGDFRTQ